MQFTNAFHYQFVKFSTDKHGRVDVLEYIGRRFFSKIKSREKLVIL